jgi:hypothetical protein
VGNADSGLRGQYIAARSRYYGLTSPGLFHPVLS